MNEQTKKESTTPMFQCNTLSVDVHKPNFLIRKDYERRTHGFAVALLLKRLLFLVDHFCDWIFSHYSISIFLLDAFSSSSLSFSSFIFFYSCLQCGGSIGRFFISFWLMLSFVLPFFVKPFIQIRYTHINCNNTFFDYVRSPHERQTTHNTQKKGFCVWKLWPLGNG